jgi:GTP 3',8-cyclase
MVDVSSKDSTLRSATASGRIYITELAYQLVTQGYSSKDGSDGSCTVEQKKAMAKATRKGDVLTVAQLAAIMGAKQSKSFVRVQIIRTLSDKHVCVIVASNLIPLCHPLAISKIDVELKPRVDKKEKRFVIECSATVACEGKTGVEMEALSATTVGLLTVWDMLKAVSESSDDFILVDHSHMLRVEGGRQGNGNR